MGMRELFPGECFGLLEHSGVDLFQGGGTRTVGYAFYIGSGNPPNLQDPQVIGGQLEALGKKKSAVGVKKIFRQHHSGLESVDVDFSHGISFFERNVFQLQI
jgi:hypothetical protein